VIVVKLTLVRAILALGTLLALAAGALVALARPAAAQGGRGPMPAAYLFIRGTDTLIVERVTSTRDTVSGEIFTRGGPRITYSAAVVTGPTGPSVPTLTMRAFGPGTPPDAPPAQVGSVRIVGDSAIVEVGNGAGATQRSPVLNPGNPLPLLNGSIALANMQIARARISSDRPYKARAHFIQGPGVPVDIVVEFPSTDSAIVTLAGQVHRFAIDRDGTITAGAIPTQGLAIVRVTGADMTRASLSRPDYGAPPGAPYTAEEVVVRTPAGHSLSGTLTMPKGANGRVPAVVTITGSGHQDRDEMLSIVPNFRPMRQLADTLGRRGIAVLRLDDRGINGSGGDVNGTSADFADDIRAGVSWLRSRSDIDPDRIGLFGHSEGGLIAPIVAAGDSRLAGIVLFAGPAYSGRKILDFQLRNLVMGDKSIPAEKKDSLVKVQFAQFDSTQGKQPWMRFFLDHDPIPTLKRVKTPVLILQGGTDQQVTPEQAPIIERTLKEAGNRDVTMRVFPARNHLFLPDSVGFPRDYVKIRDGRIGADVMGPAVDWIVLKLSASRTRP
jgi:dienelactone hydrolase